MSARLTSSQLVTATYSLVTVALDLIQQGEVESATGVLNRVLTMTEQYHDTGKTNDKSF